MIPILAQILYFGSIALGLIILKKYGHYALNFYYNRIKWHTPISREDFYKYSKYLEEGLPYYKKLSADGKAKFVNRTKTVLIDKEFEGREGLEVTEKMQVLIAGTIVQLTFGLKDFGLLHFTTIRVFPEQFYFKLYNQYLKGGTSKNGVILLSWKDFEEGFADETDKYNLGLHEIAHALKLNVTEGDKFDLLFASYLDKWLAIGKTEFAEMKMRGKGFLRDYAGTNEEEFFAVCIEHFFEVPEEFSQQLPDIYNHLCVLLNQDPRNTQFDYRLPANFAEKINGDRGLMPIPLKIYSNYKYLGWHWSFNLFIPLVFFSIISLVYLIPITLISATQLFNLALGIVIFGTILQYPWFRKKSIPVVPFFALYMLICFLPLVLIGFLFANTQLGYGEHEERYEITHVDRFNEDYIVTLNQNKFAPYPLARRFSKNEFHKNTFKPNAIHYVVNSGIFGISTIIEREAVD